MDHSANSRPISRSEGAFADQDWEGIASGFLIHRRKAVEKFRRAGR